MTFGVLLVLAGLVGIAVEVVLIRRMVDRQDRRNAELQQQIDYLGERLPGGEPRKRNMHERRYDL